MQTFLTRDEVVELTGRKQRQKQVEQLVVMQIPFTLDAFRRPKVLRRAIESSLITDVNCSDPIPLSINYDKLALGGKFNGS